MQNYQQYASGQSRRVYTPLQGGHAQGGMHPGSPEWHEWHARYGPRTEHTNTSPFVANAHPAHYYPAHPLADHPAAHHPNVGHPRHHAHLPHAYPTHPAGFGGGDTPVPVGTPSSSAGQMIAVMEGVESIIPDEFDMRDSDSETSVPETVKGREALAQATRNLMALDSPWNAYPKHHSSSSSRPSHPSQTHSSDPNAGLAGYHSQGRGHYPHPQSPPSPSSMSRRHPLTESSSDQSKRLRTNQPPPLSLSTAPNSRSPESAASPKTALLTPSQKKANHIQSEQKRRANIKKGYDALCESIPALREAIKAEEEALAQSGPASMRKRNRGGKNALDDGDKADGRAGPRSENMVLQKTIDHLRAQLAEREQLKERLKRAESHFPPGYAASSRPPGTIPLWERKWDGGKLHDPEDDHDSDDE